MGLIRSLFKLAAPVAIFAAGYYVGTIHSGQYDCVFPNHAQVPLERSIALQHPTIDEVISYAEHGQTRD